MITIRKVSSKFLAPPREEQDSPVPLHYRNNNKRSKSKKPRPKVYLKVGQWDMPEPDTPTKKRHMYEKARIQRLKRKFNYFYTPYSPGINLKNCMSFKEQRAEQVKSQSPPSRTQLVGTSDKQLAGRLAHSTALNTLDIPEEPEIKSKWKDIAHLLLGEDKHEVLPSLYWLQEIIKINKSNYFTHICWSGVQQLILSYSE